MQLAMVRGTVFHIYSPDVVKRETTFRKIEDDLTGALSEWGDQLKI